MRVKGILNDWNWIYKVNGLTEIKEVIKYIDVVDFFSVPSSALVQSSF